MATREVNEAERYLLANYQDLMPQTDRMIARSLVAADFDLHRIPRTVWRRVWVNLPGIDPRDPWKLPIEICLRLLRDHRNEIYLPKHLAGNS
jgi:hypothetical protein